MSELLWNHQSISPRLVMVSVSLCSCMAFIESNHPLRFSIGLVIAHLVTDLDMQHFRTPKKHLGRT